MITATYEIFLSWMLACQVQILPPHDEDIFNILSGIMLGRKQPNLLGQSERRSCVSDELLENVLYCHANPSINLLM